MEQAYLQSGKIYRIKYKDTGKYLTVCNGLDADDVNVIQKDLDGTLSQQFRVVYDSASDAYRIYAMCSSNGNGRFCRSLPPWGGSLLQCGIEEPKRHRFAALESFFLL